MRGEARARTRWIRNEPGPRENALALGVALGAAVGVGLVTFWLARLFASREELRPRGRPQGGAVRRPEPRGEQG